MKPQELIKKFWFIGILAIFAVIFVGMYAVDSYNNREVVVPTKQVDGQYVIYSINGENYYADDLYAELETYVPTTAFQQLSRYVVDQAIETTSEMQTLATNNASYLLSMYDKAALEADLQAMGYAGLDELDDYYLFIIKQQELLGTYLLDHADEFVTPYIEAHDPKMISHILIKVADVKKTTNEDGTYVLEANPTVEEDERLKAAYEAIEKDGFAIAAVNHSDDTSAEAGGSLGVVTKESAEGFVPEFKEAVLELEEGQMTETVLTEYGYHIIRCDASTAETLLDYQDFISTLTSEYPTLYLQVILETANQLGIEIVDENIKATLEAELNGSEVSE